MSQIARERAYVRKIERAFNALRASGLYLSPRDFTLLMDWHARGIPADLVIEVIEEVFRKAAARSTAKRIQSILYCRRAVEEAWEERRAALLGVTSPSAGGGSSGSGPGAERGGSAPPRGAFTAGEVAEHLASCAASTNALAAQWPEGLDTSDANPGTDLRVIAERLSGLGIAAAEQGAALEDLEKELLALEERALDRVRAALPAVDAIALTRAAEDAIAPYAARMSDKARAVTLRRALDNAMRARFGLPRYSLFAMNR